jgi:phosphatidylglycerol:prolipoprotein diacylglycerol transferase
MLIHPNIDPVALAIGPLAIRWYGLMYLIGFGAAWWLGRRRINQGHAPINLVQFEDLMFWCILGVILGGRIGYVLFYKPAYYLAHPNEILFIWQGGMSFHGGFLGVLIALYWIARRHQIAWLKLGDFLAPLVPIGLATGRLGNFLNGELWGRVTDVSWGMLFRDGGPMPRHPSQLYEMFAEGVLLFVLLWWYSSRPRPTGAVGGLFLLGYGFARFVCEFAREPDAFLGVLSLGMTMGQWLCLPMLLVGALLLVRSHRSISVSQTD